MGEIWLTHAKKHGERELVRFYMARRSSLGGDITVFGDVAVAKTIQPRGINPTEWERRTAIATAWRLPGEHINIYEIWAYLLALRWRLRVYKNVGARFLHLVDSRVTQGISNKGRTSSNRLRKVVAKANARPRRSALEATRQADRSAQRLARSLRNNEVLTYK